VYDLGKVRGQLKARGFLLISVPVYMRWYGPLVDAGGEK